MKLRGFCTTKEMVSKPKRPPLKENICCLHITQRTDNQNIQRTHKTKLPQNQRTNKEVVTEPNRTFSKEEIQMAKRHMKKCSPSLAIKKMQMKTTVRFHLTAVTIAIIKNANNTCWQG
jgi:hypothetical protein